MSTEHQQPDSSSSSNEADRLFWNITVTKPRKYLRHYQYLIKRENLPTVKVTILNKSLARLRCKGYERIVEMIEDVRNRNRSVSDLDADSSTCAEAERFFKDIVVAKPRKYIHHYQYVLYREDLPALKVTILNKELARLRCCGYEKVVRMIE
ncbi:hypothetical protein FF38_08820 [Lucilia cuprina]|uniref:Uncharacterized protein n=1 Tax=Lucilia cuprina TaxID=7375 RepID=A0A0L0BQS8_LUCCU|nr:hypothetical protein FF38_08820 [Lucilia cuprina]